MNLKKTQLIFADPGRLLQWEKKIFFETFERYNRGRKWLSIQCLRVGPGSLVGLIAL